VSAPAEAARPLPLPLPLSGRLAGVTGAAVLAFLGSPGVCGQDGSATLAVLGVSLWAWTVAKPLGPRPWRARAAEWLGGTLLGGALMWWVKYVVLFGVAYIGAGFGVYFVVMGMGLRLVARRLPFALAVGLCWTGVELVRALVPPPFGLGWFRLGFYAHAQLWLSGSARVIGVEGLSFVLAALGGGLAALVRARRAKPVEVCWTLAPLVLAALLARLVPAPATVDGPRVLLVQPGFTQQVKQFDDADKNLAASRDLTHRALAEVGPVDLVVWGESMLYALLFSPAAEAALAQGSAPVPPWMGALDSRDVARCNAKASHWVKGEIQARARLKSPWPEGASFAVGAECIDLHHGQLRRKVVLALYDGKGNRSGLAYKRFLVPLGETFFGLERFAPVRALAESSAGYVPDLVPGTETGQLALAGRDGRAWTVSGTVCFDNAHPWPYVDAMRGGGVDFHLVVSNEAWYETSCEMDQMVAFSRVLALMTGRAFVRATNSGVSLVLGPDGRELGRVRDAHGVDRAVAGFGAWTVPVPAPGTPARTPYAAWSRASEALWLLALALAAGLARFRARREGYRPVEAG
jgi:apolipoprotein N-acyltransferase